MKKASLSGRHGSRRAQSTPERLVDAVERLLAERDDFNLSLREITSAAGANVAAVNYHFGSKDALVNTVIERTLTEHASWQLTALRSVEADPSGTIEDVVRAWIGPSVLAVNDSRTTLIPRIAARVVSGGSAELREVATSTHAENYALLLQMLADRLTLSTDELTFRITLTAIAAAGMIVGTFDRTSIAGNPPVPQDESTLDRSVGFIVAGLSAPPTKPPSG